MTSMGRLVLLNRAAERRLDCIVGCIDIPDPATQVPALLEFARYIFDDFGNPDPLSRQEICEEAARLGLLTAEPAGWIPCELGFDCPCYGRRNEPPGPGVCYQKIDLLKERGE